MRFGLSFPNFGSYGEPGALVALARRAEEAGWEGFFVWDHVVVADSMPIADPWVVLGAIAQTTSSIRLGPMVAALPRHRPWNVARQAVSLDRLSKGRMILGVGIGFPPREEFGTFHEPQDPRVRADMLDEGLSIVEGVWSGQAFAHNGRHYQIEQTAFAPRHCKNLGSPSGWPPASPTEGPFGEPPTTTAFFLSGPTWAPSASRSSWR